jgi:membrane-associated protease RseP (regulator of RpoE activity)
MLIKLILSIACVVAMHLLTMAFCARVLGIRVRMITFGIGPKILDFGPIRISLIPAGGYVQLAMLADAPEGELMPGTLDGAARWKRVLLLLSGPLALFGVGLFFLGRPAVDQFIHAFPQLLGGALSPLGKAQDLLHDASNALRTLSTIQVLGIVAGKVAAFNLLPFLGSNGLAAATAVLPQITLDATVTKRIQSLLILPFTFLLLAGWSLAMGAFLFSH